MWGGLSRLSRDNRKRGEKGISQIYEGDGRGQTFAEVFLRISPNGRGKGIAFHSEVPEGTLPAEGHLAVEEGIRESSTVGVILGYPMTDLRVTLLKANIDSDHPSMLALKAASSNALREGCRKAQPVLMEPMMEVNIIVPEEFMGGSGRGFEGEKEFCRSDFSKGQGHHDQGHLSTDSNVRLLNRFKIPHPGKRDLLHAIFPL